MAALVAEVSASRQTIERQAGEIADLREERGRHTAELERAASAIVALGEEVETLRASHTQQASNPGPAVPAPTKRERNAPAPLPARLNALVMWLVIMLALVAGGRAAVAAAYRFLGALHELGAEDSADVLALLDLELADRMA